MLCPADQGSDQIGNVRGEIIIKPIGLENLNLNVSQQDLQNQTQDLNIEFHKILQSALTEIHSHLEEQDQKIDKILKLLDK